MQIGYHASHEQYAPSHLLRLVKRAAAAGFAVASCSDHFHPWSETHGESGFAWSWLGSALEGTGLTLGVVTVPGQRYHPAILAQAGATLAEMYPDRFWMAVGSGELLNEGITGDRWPSKGERNARLRECVAVIRRLWAGETVSFQGHIRVQSARVYSRPARPPLMVGAAITAETAEWMGGWADGLLTTSRPPEELAALVAAFHRGGGRGKPLFLQFSFSYARDYEEARQGAWEQWRAVMFDSSVLADLRSPAQFDTVAKHVRPEDLERSMPVTDRPAPLIERLKAYEQLGFGRIYLFNVNRRQEEFIEDAGAEILPVFGR